MYIDPYLAGILTTLLAEVILIIGAAIYRTLKKNNGGRK